LVNDKDFAPRGEPALVQCGSKFPDVFGNVLIVIFKIKNGVDMNSQHLVAFVWGEVSDMGAV
jgi:hypothetical protein